MSMYSNSLNATSEVIRRDNVVDIFTHTDGHRYRATKKTDRGSDVPYAP